MATVERVRVKRMSVKEAEIEAKLEKIIWPKPIPRPKVVCEDGVIVRDADVHVACGDPNGCTGDEIVSVRRVEPKWIGDR